MTEEAINRRVSELFDGCSPVAVHKFNYSKYGGNIFKPVLEKKVRGEIGEIVRDDYETDKLHLMMGEMFNYTGRMEKFKHGTSITVDFTPVVKIDCTEEAFRLISMVEDEMREEFLRGS